MPLHPLTPRQTAGVPLTNQQIDAAFDAAAVAVDAAATAAGNAATAAATAATAAATAQSTANAKQAALVSGGNIKSVGGMSLLGAGDIPINLPGESSVAFSTAIPLDDAIGKFTATEKLVNTNITLTLGPNPVPNGFYECDFQFVTGSTLSWPGTWKLAPGSSNPTQTNLKRAKFAAQYTRSGEVIIAWIPLADASGTLTVPGAPTGLTAGTPGATSMPLSLTAPATGGAPDDYIWEWSLAGSGSWNVFADGAGTALSTIIIGLPTSSTSYDFRAKASNAAGPGSYSSTITASTAAASGGGALTSAYISPPGGNLTTGFHDYVMPGRVTGTSPGWDDGKDGTSLLSALSHVNLQLVQTNIDLGQSVAFPPNSLDGGIGNGSLTNGSYIAPNGTGSAHLDFTVPAAAGVDHTCYLFLNTAPDDGQPAGTKIICKVSASLSDASASPIALSLLNGHPYNNTPVAIKFTFRAAVAGTLSVRISLGDADGIQRNGGVGGAYLILGAIAYSATAA